MLSTSAKNHIKTSVNGIEFYTVKGLEIVQKEMLRLLNIIDEIATKNDINYWIDAGNLIGVVRHDGFIPWDDDLDISLLKGDYLKLIRLLTEYSNKHNDVCLFFESPQNYHACNFFASKRVFFRQQGSPGIIPAKVDIRPMNCIESSVDSIAKNNELRDIANEIIFNKSYGYAKDIPKSIKQIHAFFYKYNNEYGLDNPKSPYTVFVHPYFEFSSQFELSYSDINPITRHKFGPIMVPIPNNTNLLLTKLYGDYMELPSLEHRAPVACKVYIKKYPEFFFRQYINRVFKAPKSSLWYRLLKNCMYVLAIGFFEYVSIRKKE